MNKIRRRIKYAVVVLLITLCVNESLAQRPIRPTQPFSMVYYHMPFQFFRNGTKSKLELNINDRFVLSLQNKSIFTYNPFFYIQPGSDQPTVKTVVQDNYILNQSFRFGFKNYLGNYSQTFHGYFVEPYLETGAGRESFYSSLGPGFGKELLLNTFRYRRVGIMVGRQYTLYDQGVVDVGCGIGYNQMISGERRYTHSGFNTPDNSAYATFTVAFGIGRIEEQRKLPRKPTLIDSLALNHALLIDGNAIIHGGIQLDWLTKNQGNGMWHFYGRYRRTANAPIKISEADSAQSLMLGAEYRYYPYANSYRNGMYLGLGYAYEHSRAYFPGNESGDPPVVALFDPHHFATTIGMTTTLNHILMLDVYLSNILTLSKAGAGKLYGRINDATGVRTELGVKFGLARFRRK